jgi:hypothetical protein
MDLEQICYEIVGWIYCSRFVVRYGRINECTGLTSGGAFLEHLCDSQRIRRTVKNSVLKIEDISVTFRLLIFRGYLLIFCLFIYVFHLWDVL